MFFLSRMGWAVVVAGGLAYIALHVFLYVSLVRFLGLRSALARRTLLAAIFLLGFSFLLEVLVPRSAPMAIRDGVYVIFGLWICTFTLLLGSTVLLWILERARGRVRFAYVTWALLALPLLITAWGAWQGSAIAITDVRVPVKHLPAYWQDKSLVHITDLHLREPGQVGFVEEIAGRIEAIAPELVLVTGDVFDVRSRDHARELLAPLAALPVPVLFVTGNHDRAYGTRARLDALDIGNLVLLDGRVYEHEGVQFIGLGYPGGQESPNPATVLKEQLEFDRGRPTILLYHTPTTVDADQMGDRYISPNTDFSIVRDLGIDLQLSGHTHGGQFFPLSWITRWIYNGHEKGLYRDGGFSLFVSSGLGTWGPPLRLFVPPEIAVIHLTGGS